MFGWTISLKQCFPNLSWRTPSPAYFVCLPYLTHLIHVLQSLLTRWWVELVVLDEGGIQNVQGLESSRTGLGTTSLKFKQQFGSFSMCCSLYLWPYVLYIACFVWISIVVIVIHLFCLLIIFVVCTILYWWVSIVETCWMFFVFFAPGCTITYFDSNTFSGFVSNNFFFSTVSFIKCFLFLQAIT